MGEVRKSVLSHRRSSYVPLRNSGRHIQALILERADGRSICALALARLTLLRKLNRYKVVRNVIA